MNALSSKIKEITDLNLPYTCSIGGKHLGQRFEICLFKFDLRSLQGTTECTENNMVYVKKYYIHVLSSQGASTMLHVEV